MSNQTNSNEDLQNQQRLQDLEERVKQLFTLIDELFFKIISLEDSMKSQFDTKIKSRMKMLKLSDFNSDHSDFSDSDLIESNVKDDEEWCSRDTLEAGANAPCNTPTKTISMM